MTIHDLAASVFVVNAGVVLLALAWFFIRDYYEYRARYMIKAYKIFFLLYVVMALMLSTTLALRCYSS